MNSIVTKKVCICKQSVLYTRTTSSIFVMVNRKQTGYPPRKRGLPRHQPRKIYEKFLSALQRRLFLNAKCYLHGSEFMCGICCGSKTLSQGLSHLCPGCVANGWNGFGNLKAWKTKFSFLSFFQLGDFHVNLSLSRKVHVTEYLKNHVSKFCCERDKKYH